VEFAKHLGVSQALVSMVWDGRKEGISSATFQRIWDYAIACGYTPKGMKVVGNAWGGSPSAIGYFLRTPFKLANKTNFFSHVTQGLHDYASENGYNVIFLGPEDDAGDRMYRRIKETLPNLKGLVVLGEISPSFQAFVDKFELPTVIVSARVPGRFHSVNSNEFQAAQLLTDHLYELGHRQFAFLGGLAPKGRYYERRDAVLHCLREKGIDPDTCHVVEEFGGADRAEGFRAADCLIQKCGVGSLPTAWIIVNGTMARGVCSRLYQEGIRIGQDISVASIDMTRVCSDEIPGLTSAAAVPEKLGWEAGRILHDSKPGDEVPLQDIVFPSKLVVRDSTGPVPEGSPSEPVSRTSS